MDLDGPLIGFADVGIVPVEIATDYTNKVSPRAYGSPASQQLMQKVKLAAGEFKRLPADHHGPHPVIEGQTIVVQGAGVRQGSRGRRNCP